MLSILLVLFGIWAGLSLGYLIWGERSALERAAVRAVRVYRENKEDNDKDNV